MFLYIHLDAKIFLVAVMRIYFLLQPSYKVNVTKNGELIASYWVPKGEYRFAIETNTDQVNRKTVQEDIIVNMPRLPVS